MSPSKSVLDIKHPIFLLVNIGNRRCQVSVPVNLGTARAIKANETLRPH
jgi:hypothetical protein